jgi:radical SAM superfamily enzyme YgiQ (UPF0313 family)
MRVVFIDNLLFEDAEGIRRYTLQPNLGLLSLIAVLEKERHEGVLFDPKVEIARGNLHLNSHLYTDIARQVLELKPDVLGLTSLGCNFICTAKVAGYLRSWAPELPILLGGPHATVLDKVILRAFPQFDVIARNESECTILPLLEALPKRKLFEVPGITFRAGGAIWRNEGDPRIDDLDTLPMPAYHHYPVQELKLSSLRVEAGRGCPFQCTFCSTASFFGRKYRLKSAERLVKELDTLHDAYGISEFALSHDLFTVNRRKVIEFCDAVASRGYIWKVSARMDCVDENLLEQMSAAGCRAIYYGIESGSERMQTISKKRLDLKLFEPILATTQRLGMSATVSFITGYPEETREDQNATLDLVGSCFGRDTVPLNVQLHLLTPEPGTELLQNYRDQIAYDGHISDFNFPALESDDSTIIETNPDVFINHHYFPASLARRRHVFVTTAYQNLHSLGFPLLRYILKLYDGSFHRLMEAMYEWTETTGRSSISEPADVAAFFSETVGATHHISGLVRYLLAAAELRRRASLDYGSVRSPLPVSEASLYRLSSRSIVVRDVPNCSAILEALTSNPPTRISSSLLKRRFNFLLYLSPDHEEVVRNFELTEASTTLMEYLDAPTSWQETQASFERDTGLPAPPPSFITALADFGLLEVA